MELPYLFFWWYSNEMATIKIFFSFGIVHFAPRSFCKALFDLTLLPKIHCLAKLNLVRWLVRFLVRSFFNSFFKIFGIKKDIKKVFISMPKMLTLPYFVLTDVQCKLTFPFISHLVNLGSLI